MTPRQLAPALVLFLAVPSGLAFAQRSHGGRGGSHHGGGFAVPRGSSMGGHPSGGRGWTGGHSGRSYGHGGWGGYNGYRGHGGSYYGHGGSYYGHGHGGGYRSYYRGYRPYYGYPYYGYRPYYYAPYFSASLYWGWPYSYWPSYSTGPSYYATGPDYAASYEAYDSVSAPRATAPAPSRSRAPVTDSPGESGQLRLEVRPEDASVYVDDEFRGTAADARQLALSSGRHTVELVRPGYRVEHHVVEVVRGARSDLLVELRRP